MFPAEEIRKSSLPPVRVRLPILRQGIVIFESKNRLNLRGGSELLLRNRAHALKSSPPNDKQKFISSRDTTEPRYSAILSESSGKV
jgi:hypothetical protein